jgi:hypothetical protein
MEVQAPTMLVWAQNAPSQSPAEEEIQIYVLMIGVWLWPNAQEIMFFEDSCL